MSDVTPADLQAIGDIADWLIEQSDGLPTEQAIVLLQAANEASAKLHLAIDLLRSQVMKTIEQPILLGNTVWSKKRKTVKRPNQAKIASAVVKTAVIVDEKTGDMGSPTGAAERAVQLMRILYVSPSTVPKVGGVKALGLSMDDVTEVEHTGWELQQTQIDTGP